MNFSLLIFTCIFTLCFCSSLYKRTPVIFVPGDGGNQIEAKLNKSNSVHYICEKESDYYTIWLNLEELVPLIIDCWVDNVKLIYDNETRTTRNQPGVDTRIPGWGDSYTVEWLDPSEYSPGAYFKDVGNALVNSGYVRKVSLRGAPFDFRKGPNENQQYFKDLKKLVEETYMINKDSPVLLIGHSMGALMSLYFLQNVSQKWKDKYIRGLLTLNGVWAGSVKSVKVYYMGDDLGVYVLPDGTMKEMQISMPSLAWLLPSPYFWKSNEVLVQTNNKNYSLSNLEEYFKDIDYVNGWEMRKDLLNYLDFSPPGVELWCIHGSGVDTVERLVFNNNKFPFEKPNFIYGDGDGTVNKRSLEACLRWNKTGNKGKKIHHYVFPKVDHNSILSNNDVINLILKVALKG